MVRVAGLVAASCKVSEEKLGEADLLALDPEKLDSALSKLSHLTRVSICGSPYSHSEAVQWKNEVHKNEGESTCESRKLAPEKGVREFDLRFQPERPCLKDRFGATLPDQPGTRPKESSTLSGDLRTQLTLKRIQLIRKNDLPPYQPYLKDQGDHFGKFANLVSRIGSLGYVMKGGSNREIAQHLIYLAAHALSWAENYVEDLP